MCDIPQIIKLARENQGLTVYALAKMAGLSSTHCYAIEAGEKTPTLKSLLKILAVLGLTIIVQKAAHDE